MKRRLRHCPLLLVAVAAIGCPRTQPAASPTNLQGPSAAQKGARLEMRQAVHDVGDVDFGVTQRCNVAVRNAGDAPLKLTLVYKNCACTEATVPSEIAPGTQGAVALRWMPIPGQNGLHRIICDIETNDAGRPKIRVEMQGNVNPAIRVTPEDISFIDFYKLEPGAVKPRELKVFSTKLSAFDLDATTDLPGLKITKSKLDIDATTRIGDARPTCAYSVIVETTPKLPPGYFTTDLVMKLKPPDAPARTVRMRMYGEVANGLFKVMPDEVEFKKPNLADGDVQKVRVQFIDPAKKQTLKIVSVEPSFLKCDEPRMLPGAAGQWEFSVRVPPGNADAAKAQPNHFFEGRLVLQASGSDAKIPVRVKWIPPQLAEKP